MPDALSTSTARSWSSAKGSCLQDSPGLGIRALSYDGAVFFELNCDPDIVDCMRRRQDAVDSEVGELFSVTAVSGSALRVVGTA